MVMEQETELILLGFPFLWRIHISSPPPSFPLSLSVQGLCTLCEPMLCGDAREKVGEILADQRSRPTLPVDTKCVVPLFFESLFF